MRACCPACYSSIDARSSRCAECTSELERVPAGPLGVVVGAVSAVVSAVQGAVIGLLLGAVFEVFSGVPHVAVLLEVGLAMAFALNSYLLKSTRLRVRHPGDHLTTVNVAREIKIVDLRHG